MIAHWRLKWRCDRCHAQGTLTAAVTDTCLETDAMLHEAHAIVSEACERPYLVIRERELETSAHE